MKNVETTMSVLIRALIGVLLGAVGIGVLFALAILITGDDTEANFKFISCCSLVAIYAGLAIASAVFIRMGRFPVLMWLALLACPAAVVTWMILIWFGETMDDDRAANLARFAGTATVGVVGSLHTGAFGHLSTRNRALHWSRWVLIALAWCFAAMLLTIIWLAEWLEMVVSQWVLVTVVFTTAGFGGIALLGSLLVRIAFRLEAERERRRAASVPSSVRMGLVCPECGDELSLGQGNGRCRCGFSVNVEFEEPRCACGYLLFRLSGDLCPECGAIVPPDQRWSSFDDQSDPPTVSSTPSA
ncbi:MAG: hypothetical protein ACYTGP_06120 [Planctomycetota bacterium]